jgi:hypothetical protein
MNDPRDIQVSPQHIIDILKQQRDVAMDEIVKMGAIIKTLQDQLQAKEKGDGEHDKE